VVFIQPERMPPPVAEPKSGAGRGKKKDKYLEAHRQEMLRLMRKNSQLRAVRAQG
jgi:hypothetical protein